MSVTSKIQNSAQPGRVASYPAAHLRTPPRENLLEERWLHKVFLATHIPAGWRAWQLALALLFVAGVTAVFWQVGVGAAGITAALLYLLFALGDWLLFWWLPRSGRSFGPIGPQLLVCTFPRAAAMLLAALVAALTGAVAAGLALAALAQLAGTLIYLWGALREPFALAVAHEPATAAAWPAESPPLRLLHLSDLHVERLTRREEQLLRHITQLQPDLIVITGDYLNLSYVDDPTARAEVRELLAQLSAPLGVFAVLGSPPADPRASTPGLFEGLNIRLLRDEVAVVNLPDGRTLSLLGMDCEHDLDSDASVFERLVELAPASSARVLLYHSPELMPLARQHPVDLYLCGHTHGGQIRLPGYGAVLTSAVTGKQYEAGRYDEQETTLYVSRGIGLEGLSAPRMRLLCPPEIILFSLAGTS